MSVSQTMLADAEAYYHRILDQTGYSVDRHEDVALKSLIFLCKGNADDVERSVCEMSRWAASLLDGEERGG